MPEEILTCIECGERFLWGLTEQHYYRDNNLAPPKHCRRHRSSFSYQRDKREDLHTARTYSQPGGGFVPLEGPWYNKDENLRSENFSKPKTSSTESNSSAKPNKSINKKWLIGIGAASVGVAGVVLLLVNPRLGRAALKKAADIAKNL